MFVISIQAAVCLNTPTCLTDKTNCVSTFVKVEQQGRKLEEKKTEASGEKNIRMSSGFKCVEEKRAKAETEARKFFLQQTDLCSNRREVRRTDRKEMREMKYWKR